MANKLLIGALGGQKKDELGGQHAHFEVVVVQVDDYALVVVQVDFKSVHVKQYLEHK